MRALAVVEMTTVGLIVSEGVIVEVAVLIFGATAGAVLVDAEFTASVLD